MILPNPPTSAQKLSYIIRNRFFYYVPGLLSFLVLMSGVVLFSVSNPAFYVYLIFGAVIFFYLGISYLIGFLGEDFNYMEHLCIRDKAGYDLPSVDIFYPICGEDIKVIENTMMGISLLAYPGILNVYVLDDGHSDEVKSLSHRYEFTYIRRPDRGVLKKAGNMRNAFSQTKGELILVLDADFTPRFDMLLEMVPYMVTDKKIAIVQSPQYFSIRDGQTWVEKGASYIQELFYRMIQTSRDSFGASICVGTCALYRRSSLDPFGGTAPIEYSEDVHTGFMVCDAGWKIKYIPINLSKGVCPETLSQFFIQQYRWATGSISLFLNKKFWKSNLTLMQKACYLSGMLYYITTGLSIFITPLPSMILLAFLPKNIMWFNAVFSVPSFIFGTLGVALWTRAKFGSYSIWARYVSHYSHLFALKDRLFGTLVPWQVTGTKSTNSKRFEDFKFLLKFWTIFQTTWVIYFVYFNSQTMPFYNFIPTVFFTLFNLWIVINVLKSQDC
jgi:cellulose synthase/poly-beta-1,6-N-acetylglucosamine synthase-like glycosyltransferase